MTYYSEEPRITRSVEARWWSGSTSQFSSYGALNLDADRCKLIIINKCCYLKYTIRFKETLVPRNATQFLFFYKNLFLLCTLNYIFPRGGTQPQLFRNYVCLLLFVPSAQVVQWQSVCLACGRSRFDPRSGQT